MILLREIMSDESARSLSRDKYQSKKEQGNQNTKGKDYFALRKRIELFLELLVYSVWGTHFKGR